MPPKQPVKIDLESAKEAWGGPMPKELTAVEPGWLNKVAGEVAEIKEKQLHKKAHRYDPYSFLDQMAMPFDTVTRLDIPMEGLKITPGETPLQITPGVAPFDESDPKKPMPHCKACTDFKTWMELTAHPRRNLSKEEREQKECPLDSELLGRNTWSFLHTMAAYFPEKPSAEQQGNMKKFITLLSQFYPCHKCASHLREDLKTNSPDVSSNIKLSEWFCKLHNSVNVRLGKSEFDCVKVCAEVTVKSNSCNESPTTGGARMIRAGDVCVDCSVQVLERWRDGWADGTCD